MRIRCALVCVTAGVLLAAGGASARQAFDINGYIVGSWRNVDNQHVYVIAKAGAGYELRAGGSWTTGEGCPVASGTLFYQLIPKQTVGGYLNGGDYYGAWTLIKKDDKGNCQQLTIAHGAAGYYEDDTGFVPTTGAKTAENPDGQYLNWYCAYTHPYTQCGVLSRIGKGFVQPAAGGGGGGGTSTKPWPALPDARVALGSVSNGCGGGEASAEGRFGDTSTYLNSNDPRGKRYVVNFRLACNLHDAGYSGAKVIDTLNGGEIDYFGWNQKQVDDKFLRDMRKLCDEQIPKEAAVALADCKGRGGKTSFGAETRYNFVRSQGHRFWRDRPNLAGRWTGGSAALQVRQTGRTVRATWAGGEFRGTVISRDQDSIVKGYARTTESGGSKQVAMTITVDPDTPNEIKVSGPGLPPTLTR